MPALLAAAMWMALAVHALAADRILVVGVVHDQDGEAVGGAIVSARRADGIRLGQATVAADGTFALDASALPDDLVVACRFCQETRVPFVPGADVSIAVVRYRGLASGGPTGADLAALPPQRAGAAAELVPFAVVNAGAITDRGVGLGRDATVIDGLPLYRRLDGTPLAGALPASALASVVAIGRNVQVTSTDADAAMLLASSDGFSSAARVRGTIGLTTAYDRGASNARFAGLQIAAPFAGGTVSAHVIDDATDNVNFNGVQGAYFTGSRRFLTSISASALQSNARGWPESDTAFDAHLTNRGAAGLTFGVEGRRSVGAISALSGAQDDVRAYVGGALGGPRTTLAFGLAADPLLLPSATLTQGLSANTTLRASLHDDVVAPTLLDAAAFAREALVELALSTTDARRVSIEALAYDETTTGSADATLRGVGVRVAYQIAPHVLVRSWLLRADSISRDVPPEFGDAYTPIVHLGPYLTNGAARLDRQTAWITYDGAVRIDAISRADGLDASIGTRVARYRITLGTIHAAGRHELVLTLAR